MKIIKPKPLNNDILGLPRNENFKTNRKILLIKNGMTLVDNFSKYVCYVHVCFCILTEFTSNL